MRASANRANEYMMARYDVGNPAALKRLVAAGTQLRPFPESVLDACFKAANEVYADITGKNEDFKKIYESIRPSGPTSISGSSCRRTPSTTT